MRTDVENETFWVVDELVEVRGGMGGTKRLR